MKVLVALELPDDTDLNAFAGRINETLASTLPRHSRWFVRAVPPDLSAASVLDQILGILRIPIPPVVNPGGK